MSVFFGVEKCPPSARIRATYHTAQVCRLWKDTKRNKLQILKMKWEGCRVEKELYICMK